MQSAHFFRDVAEPVGVKNFFQGGRFGFGHRGVSCGLGWSLVQLLDCDGSLGTSQLMKSLVLRLWR